MQGRHTVIFFLFGVGFLLLSYLLFTSFSLSFALGFFLLLFLILYSAFFFAMIANSISRFLSPSNREKVLWARAIILDFFLQSYVILILSFLNIKKWQIRGSGTPLLLVHGYLHPSAVWIHLMHRLQKAGFGPIYTLKMGNPFDSIAEYAERLSEKAFQIFNETKNPNLILIGHSMGGLVSAYYATKLDEKDLVTHVITIGSPLKGTDVAKIGIGKCTNEMTFHSDFTEELVKEMQKEKKVKFFHIGSKTDQLVIPYTSSFVIEEPSRSLLLEGVGHIGLLFSRKVAKKIMEWLRLSTKRV